MNTDNILQILIFTKRQRKTNVPCLASLSHPLSVWSKKLWMSIISHHRCMIHRNEQEANRPKKADVWCSCSVVEVNYLLFTIKYGDDDTKEDQRHKKGHHDPKHQARWHRVEFQGPAERLCLFVWNGYHLLLWSCGVVCVCVVLYSNVWWMNDIRI